MVLTEAAIAGVLEKAFLKNFAKLTGKYLHQGLLFNNVAGPRYFSVNLGTFLRTPFLRNIPRRDVVLWGPSNQEGMLL